MRPRTCFAMCMPPISGGLAGGRSRFKPGWGTPPFAARSTTYIAVLRSGRQCTSGSMKRGKRVRIEYDAAVTWTPARQQELGQQLVGFWAQDVWDMTACPVG